MSRSTRRLALGAITVLALAAGASTAQAADLLVLQGEQVELSGANTYGIVYIDGEVRLVGDTTINAGSVYIGPDAYLRTCYVSGSGDTCTAGRSLAIHSASTLTIEPSIDLTGRQGATRPGGSLTLSGTDVSVGGSITTTGNGAASGSVAIDSSGVATTGSITANGAPVVITAARHISVNGDIRTEGIAQVPAPPSRLQPGAPVAIASSGGDLAVRGNITTYGRDAGSGQGPGGVGADVSLSGADVRVGGIDTTGGTSTDADSGPSGTITLRARGSLQALGRLDVSGGSSTNGTATPGTTISAIAAGPVTLAGGAGLGGGSSPTTGAPGGALDAEGTTVALGAITAGGGNATSAATPRNGGSGGSVVVRGTGAVTLATIGASGGNAPTGAHGGTGGSVAVTAQSISAGQITTMGGTTSSGAGADGGPVTLDADGSLTLGGSLTTSGSNAGGTPTPVVGGGSAGHVLLRAATGTLDLGAPVWANGGRGSQGATTGVKGGLGGSGGGIDIVAHALGTIVSVVADGGAGGGYGDDQGAGGAGGAIHGFTDGPLLDDLKVVEADGGDGKPAGSAGSRTVESSPTALAVSPAGVLSFTSRSPGASRFRILRSVNGAAATTLAETTATSASIAGPMCVPVTVTVVALADAVRWTSDAPATVSYTAQPSATQRCGDPPALKTAEKKVRRKLKTLRKAHWKLTVKLVSAGVGHVDATLLSGRKAIGVAAADAQAGKTVALRFALPKRARGAGKLRLRLVATAPDGSKKLTTTNRVEVLSK